MISPMPFPVLVEARKDSRHKEGMPWGSRGTLFALKCIGNISGVSSLRTWPTLNYLSENGMYRSAETPPKHRLCAKKPESPHQSPQRKVSCPSGLSQVQEGKDKREEPELSSSSAPTNHLCLLPAWPGASPPGELRLITQTKLYQREGRDTGQRALDQESGHWL